MSLEQVIEEAVERALRRVLREELAAAQPQAAELITIAAYAKRRSISKSTVRGAVREGRLPVTRIGRAVRIAANAEIGERVVTKAPAAAAERILFALRGGR